MFSVVEKLHSKPKDTRRRIGIFFAGFITFVIFIIWMTTLGSQFDRRQEEVSGEDQVRVLSPFETLGEGFSSLVNTTKKNFSDIGF